MTDHAYGEVLGFVVVTWNQASGQPGIDTAGMHDDIETAIADRDSRRAETKDLSRGEQHEVATVILNWEGT